MKTTAQIAVTFFILILVTACGSNATYISFQSNPQQARVFVRPIDQDEFKEIGLTPLRYPASEIDNKFNGSGPMAVEIRKDGYRTERTIITELSAIELKIKMDLRAEDGLEDQRLLNWVIESMFEVKSLVTTKRYEDALKKISKIKETVPQVAAVYELEGGVLYLQEKYLAALEAYTRASRYNPQNLEIKKMKELVKEKVKNSNE